MEANGSESVKMNWGKPVTKCPIKNYAISYTGNVLWDENQEEHLGNLVVGGGANETVVDELKAYTEYKFCIVAQNSEGNGTEFTCTDVTTLEGGK